MNQSSMRVTINTLKGFMLNPQCVCWRSSHFRAAEAERWTADVRRRGDEKDWRGGHSCGGTSVSVLFLPLALRVERRLNEDASDAPAHSLSVSTARSQISPLWFCSFLCHSSLRRRGSRETLQHLHVLQRSRCDKSLQPCGVCLLLSCLELTWHLHALLSR